MKTYLLSICILFIATNVYADHAYHTQGVVSTPTGEKSLKVPVYPTPISNNPTGDIYIRTGKISRYTIGTYSKTTRKKNRKGTFTIQTIQKSVIEDDAQNPLEKANIPGATKNLIGYVRNPHYSVQAPALNKDKNVCLYEYTGNIPAKPSMKPKTSPVSEKKATSPENQIIKK